MRNLYAEFLRLVPSAPLQIGTVIDITGTAALVQLPDGATLRAHGNATIGESVFVRDGLIEGSAPELPVEIIDI